MKGRVCELCREEAALYCDSDHAFLCWACDEEVHGANFLVARHLRQPLCSTCKALAGDSISGVGLRHSLRSLICSNCSPEQGFPGDNESECSVCVSSKESKLEDAVGKKRKMARVFSSSSVTGISGLSSPVRLSGRISSEKITGDCKKLKMKKKTGNDQNRLRALTGVDAEAEGIFVNWCRDLGLTGDSAIAVMSTATHALGLCLSRTARVLPLRVSLAASFWYGLGCLGYNRPARVFHVLRKVAQISGVPARLILAVRLKLERELRARNSRPGDLEEGWAECSG